MNRVGDYCGFGMRFVGIGYIAQLPLAATLPPGLHLLGMTCAGGFCVCLVVGRLSRWRRNRAQRALTLAARTPAALMRRSRRTPARPVKPRSHFGMRGGVPH